MTESPITEQLSETRAARITVRERRTQVEQQATSGDYGTRAAARIELEDVDRELARLEAALPPIEAAAARQATMARLTELAGAGAAALQDVRQAQQAFDAAISPLLEAYSAARARQAEVRATFYTTLASLAPGATNRGKDQAPAEQLIAELETAGADLGGVLTNVGDYGYLLDRPDAGTHQFPGALSTAQREAAARQIGHALPPGTISSPLADGRTAAQLLTTTH